MWTKYHFFLAGVMIITGSINTLSTKWADDTVAVGIKNDAHKFNHPFLQACGMFLGEMLCFLGFAIVYLYQKYKVDIPRDKIKFNPIIFLLPALCDMCGTSTMYFGLTMTYPSSFQMLRGAVIIFTGLLSVAFLGRKLHLHQWLGMAVVIIGLFTVGAADFVTGDSSAADRNAVITGDLLIITAQIIVAVQMVIEEKFVTKHNVPPLLAVGFEGLFGFVILSLLLIPMYYVILPAKFAPNPEHRFEDALDAFAQLKNSWQVSLATFGNIASIAFFNFAGISITKEMSATTRMVLDSVRTVIIWAVSLAIKSQKFHYLQVIGFIALIIGMCFYYDIVIMPFLQSKGFCLKLRPTEEENRDPAVENSVNAEIDTHNSDRDQLVIVHES